MDAIFETMSSMSTAEKILQIDLFIIIISVSLLTVVIFSMFFVFNSKTYNQLLASLKFFCFVLAVSLSVLFLGYLSVDAFAEQVNLYLLPMYEIGVRK